MNLKEIQEQRKKLDRLEMLEACLDNLENALKDLETPTSESWKFALPMEAIDAISRRLSRYGYEAARHVPQERTDW